MFSKNCKRYVENNNFMKLFVKIFLFVFFLFNFFSFSYSQENQTDKFIKSLILSITDLLKSAIKENKNSTIKVFSVSRPKYYHGFSICDDPTKDGLFCCLKRFNDFCVQKCTFYDYVKYKTKIKNINITKIEYQNGKVIIYFKWLP